MRCAECRHWRQSLLEPVDKAQPSHHRWFLAMAIPALLVLLIWVVFAWSLAVPDGFFWLGIYPRTVSGLVGIALGPLIHANLQHAVANSVPLLVLGTFLFYFYPNQALRVLAIVWLCAGIGTWIIGLPSSGGVDNPTARSSRNRAPSHIPIRKLDMGNLAQRSLHFLGGASMRRAHRACPRATASESPPR